MAKDPKGSAVENCLGDDEHALYIILSQVTQVDSVGKKRLFDHSQRRDFINIKI